MAKRLQASDIDFHAFYAEMFTDMVFHRPVKHLDTIRYSVAAAIVAAISVPDGVTYRVTCPNAPLVPEDSFRMAQNPISSQTTAKSSSSICVKASLAGFPGSLLQAVGGQTRVLEQSLTRTRTFCVCPRWSREPAAGCQYS